MTTGVLVLVAAVWGALAGTLLPRAAYRFAVPYGEPWRSRCPGGHPVRGWLGGARCGDCGPGAASRTPSGSDGAELTPSGPGAASRTPSGSDGAELTPSGPGAASRTPSG
ncbi:prepilin peptidase, partial [Streptomyces sp. NPDC013455]